MTQILSNSAITDADSRLVNEDEGRRHVRWMNRGEIPGSLSGLELSDSSKKIDGSENHCFLIIGL